MATVETGVGQIIGPPLLSGKGTPEGVTSSIPGGLFRRLDGGSNASLYVKESGVSNTGWGAVVSSSRDVSLAALSGNQAGVPVNTWTKVLFNTPVLNQGKYSGANSRWTPSSGYVALYVQLQTTVAGDIYAGIGKNGGVVWYSHNGADSFCSMMTVDYANGTDYYEAWIYSSVANTVSGASNITYFIGFKIS